jgi:hypothetical protein
MSPTLRFKNRETRSVRRLLLKRSSIEQLPIGLIMLGLI